MIAAIRTKVTWLLRKVRMIAGESGPMPSDSDSQVKPLSQVPGPIGLPLFGTVLQYMTGWDGFSFEKMFEAYQRRAQLYGPIYMECIGHICNVVVTDYNEYRKVIKADGRMPRRIPLEPLLFYRIKNALDNGMVNGDGEGWYKLRTASSKKMMRSQEVTLYLGMMDEVTKDMLMLLADTRDDAFVAYNINALLFRWSMESVNTFLLDTRLGTLDRSPTHESQLIVTHINGLFACMQQLMFDLPVYKFLPTPMWRQFEGHCDKVFEHAMNIIDRRWNEIHAQTDPNSNTRESVLSDLISNTDLSKVEINSLICELMIGSVETVSNTLLWCMYLLAKEQRSQQVLYDEIFEVVGESPIITIDHITNLHYVKACIRETMRLYPATFATSRILTSDLELCGYHIPAGTHVQANTYALCRDPTIFPEPDQFIPERWLERSDRTMDMSITNLIWGHGARMCIGRKIAEQEMYIGLIRLIQRFHLFYNEKEEPKPVLHTVMTTDKPLSLKLTDRSPV